MAILERGKQYMILNSIFGLLISVFGFVGNILIDIGIYFMKLLVLIAEGILKLVRKLKRK